MTATAIRTRLDRQAKLLSDATGIQFTIGYIGNVSGSLDDRTWYAFAEHPGRVGTRDDRIGGVSTDNLATLVTMLSGAIALTIVQSTPR